MCHDTPVFRERPCAVGVWSTVVENSLKTLPGCVALSIAELVEEEGQFIPGP